MKSLNISTLHALVFLCILSLFSCKKDDETVEPGLCFEVTEGDLFAEMEIRFDASCSEAFEYYAWDFGDGDVGTGMQVNHVYEKEGQYKVILTVSNSQDDIKTMEKTIDVLPSQFVKHCDDIEGDQVWEEGMHLVRCNISVNGTLTIQPGAIIYIEEENLLEINGKLIAQGTAAKPIKFIPSNNTENPGSWGYIHFTPTASSESIMEYCEIKFGGKADSFDYPDWEYYSHFGMIHLNECAISINHTTIQGAANYGISLSKNAKFISFENNTFTGNANHPLRIYGNGLQSIGSTSTFTGEKDILIAGDMHFDPGKDVTWHKQDVPYLIDGSIDLIADFNVSIEAGTILKLQSDQVINNGYLDFSTGSVTAVGTESEPIIFTSAEESKNRGDWAGIMISDNSRLEHCMIEYAGFNYTISGYNRALSVSGSTAVVNNCTIRESSGYGIEIGATGGEIGFNTIQNCSGYGVTVDIMDHQVFDKTNIIENTGGFFLSGGGIHEDVSLEKRVYPYVLQGLSFYANATLTIEAGTEIQVRSAGDFTMGFDRVSSSYSGNLIANGTPELPVKFSLYYKDKEAGSSNWGALVFGEESTTSVLNNCIITDGGYVVDGNSDPQPDMGMIHCFRTTGFPTITNCTITNSATYGITLDGATAMTSGNVFSNNASGNEYSY